MRSLALLFFATSLQAAITGTLIDEQGKPVAGVTVEAFPAESSRALHARLLAGTALSPITTAQSSDAGVFSLNPKTPLTDIAVRVGGRLVIALELLDGQDAGAI